MLLYPGPYPPKPLSSHFYRTTPSVSILHSLPPHSLLATHWLLVTGQHSRGSRKGQNAESPEPNTSCSTPSILGTVPFLVHFLPLSCQYESWVSAFHLLTADTRGSWSFLFTCTQRLLQYCNI